MIQQNVHDLRLIAVVVAEAAVRAHQSGRPASIAERQVLGALIPTEPAGMLALVEASAEVTRLVLAIVIPPDDPQEYLQVLAKARLSMIDDQIEDVR